MYLSYNENRNNSIRELDAKSSNRIKGETIDKPTTCYNQFLRKINRDTNLNYYQEWKKPKLFLY